jgi:predicted PurR-regulated permease PerM
MLARKKVPLEAVKARRLVFRAIGLVFALALAVYIVFQIPHIVLLFLLTLLFAIVLSGPVNYLARVGLPRGLGTLVVLVGIALVLWLASRAVTPSIVAQATQFASDAPALLVQVQDYTTNLQSALGMDSGTMPSMQGLLEAGRGYLSENASSAASIGRSLVETISLSVVALIVTIYLVVQPTQLVNGLVSLFPAKQRERVRGVLGEMYHAVQKWLLGQLASMVIIGVLSTIALFIIGIRYALFLGALSGLLAFIPLVGALVSAIPPIFLALALDPISVLWVILAYILIHQIEAHLIQPLVMSRAAALHPVVVVFGILIMGTLFGLVGLLLAVPLMAATGVLVHELWVSRMDQIGVDPHPPPAPDVDKGLRRTGLLGRALNILRQSR